MSLKPLKHDFEAQKLQNIQTANFAESSKGEETERRGGGSYGQMFSKSWEEDPSSRAESVLRYSKREVQLSRLCGSHPGAMAIVFPDAPPAYTSTQGLHTSMFSSLSILTNFLLRPSVFIPQLFSPV